MQKMPDFDNLTGAWRRIRSFHRRLTKRFIPPIRLGASVMQALTFLAAIGCLTILVVMIGYDRSAIEAKTLHRILRWIQALFVINVLYGMLFGKIAGIGRKKTITWIVETGVLLTVVPLALPHPEHPWLPWLEQIAYGNVFLYAMLGAYSLVFFCLGITRLMGRHTNPSLILAGSFFALVILGSLLLMMPRCTYTPLSYVDSLFVATSAVCITGLTTVDVSTVFTPTGLVVLAVMIQIGGLGVMTFTSFFALFFSGNNSIYSQLMIKDMIYSKSLSALLPTLLYILAFTLTIEAAGAVLIYFTIDDVLPLSTHDKIVFSAFHSLSAFCNAGFSNIGGGLSNPLLLYSNQWLYIVVSWLVIAGGIGFPLLVNFSQATKRQAMIAWKRLTGQKIYGRKAHLLDLNTKIVLVTSAWLTVGATALFFLLEQHNTLAGMGLWERCAQSFFNSTVPRSSGFSSVNPSQFLNITIIMFLFLMWIGGGSQSTAGGIKVNTFAVMVLNLKAVILGRERVTAYHRTIARESIRTAHAVICLSILVYVALAAAMVGLEPDLPTKSVLYETASALFTVGSSLGITASLSVPAKCLICVAMYFGRVGLMSLIVGVVGRHNDPPVRFPDENVIIN